MLLMDTDSGKRGILKFILLWTLLFPSFWVGAGLSPAHSLEVPRLDHYVNDYAGILTSSQRSTLEEMLRQHEAQTTNQVVILTLPSLEGESLEEFSIRVAHGRIGQKGKDNGVLLLVAMKERKIRIEVGYGLEGALTDAESSLIIRRIIAPAFRSGDYFGGLYAGTRAILQAIEGEFRAARSSDVPRRGARGSLSGLFLMLLIPLGLFGILPTPLRVGGGGLLGFLGGLIIFHSLIAAVIGAVFGLGFLFLLSLGGALQGPFRGGFWGGGFGGGGFSGGGGGFGGGGASGSW